MLRPYDPDQDAAALWALKAAFERELGAAGGDEKADSYEGKLTDDYRERYLDWARRCVADEDCILVAPGEDGAGGPSVDGSPVNGPGGRLDGYVFVLPARLALVWDAAVVNEIYVRPDRRGSGLADELLAAALDHARGQDLPLDRVVLDVDRENERARAFYERHGFSHWGEMVAREL